MANQYKISFPEKRDSLDAKYLKNFKVTKTTSKSGKTNTYTGTKDELHIMLGNKWGNYYFDKGTMAGTKLSPKSYYEKKMKKIK